MADHNLDSLTIKIKSDARSANNALNTLERHLDKLAGSLASLGAQSAGLSRFSASVTELSTAMINFKNSGIGTADFSRLVKNIGQLSTIDHAGIEATANSLDRLSQSMGNISVLSENASKVTEFTKAMSSLGRKGVSEAINNLPRLTEAFQNLLVTLNETPEIRQDIISMTQALAEFVSGAKGYVNQARSMQESNTRIKISVGYAEEALKKFADTAKRAFKFLVTSPFKAFATGAKALASGLQSCVGKLKTFATHSERAEKSASKFATTIGTLYVKFWLLARVVGKLWSSVKSSFDYLETVNYFSSSFEAIAKKATSTLSDAGEESAQAYYKSFTDTAQTLTRKMTGFDISGGQLQMTKGANLGLDPNTTLNYQTTFAQIASSMGVASDKAVKLSNVLTEVGADLASVKNMDFEEVWQNMASAMVGMSRAVDKYGVNIRASAMQEKLLSLGIQANVKDLSQADKALLRTIIILDSTKYAVGDLADTLDMPANQIRMLTANLHKLAMMFGSLFLPILKKVLPYINALVIALQRLMQTLMNVFGIDLSSMLPKGGAGASDALSDVLDDAEGTDEALEDATDQAKKLKNNLLGIDELNILNDNQDDKDNLDDLGVSGLLDQAFLDAIDEYQSAWDEAFKRLENKAQEIADRIVEWAKKVWKPIGEAWDAVGDEVIEKWKYMTGELGKLFKDIARDWATVWAQDNTEKIFENIFLSVGNMFELVGNLARQFRDAWNENDKGLHILENVRDIIKIISEHVRDMTKFWAEWAGQLDFNPLLASIEKLTGAIKDNLDDILDIVDDMQKLFLAPTFEYIVESFLPRLNDILSKLVTEIKWDKLRLALQDLWEGLAILAQVLGDGLLTLLDKLADIIINFVNGDYIKNFTRDFKELANSLKDAKDINDVINALFDFADGRAIDATKIINAISRAFNDAIEKVDWKHLGNRIGEFISNFVLNLDTASLGKNISNIAKAFLETILGALEKVQWREIGHKIGEFLKNIDWLEILNDLWKVILGVASSLGDVIGGSLEKSPLATSIILAVVGLFTTGKIKDAISRATGGKGLIGDWLSSLLGSKDKLGKESSLFGDIADKATKASGAKDLFAQANGRVADSADLTGGRLKYELQFFAETEKKAGSIAKTLGGIGAVLGGSAMAIGGFIKQWNEGFSALGALITGVGIAIAGVGAVLLGAPATVVAVIGAIVFAVAEGIVLIHEHWDEICAWWNNTVVPAVSGFFEGIGEKFKGFVDGIGQKWDDLKLVLSLQWQLIKEGFSTFVQEWGQKITEWASTKWEEITNKIEEVRNNIKMKWDEMKQNFADHITEWRTKIEEWSSQKWEDITNKLEEIRSGIQTKWQEMQQNFTDHISEWHNRITQWASERWDEITNKVADVRDYIQDRWGEMKQHFEEHITHWRESITEWATSKWDEITSTMDTIKGEIQTRWESMKQDFDDFKERWKEKIEEWASNKWDAITDAMSELRDKISEKWENFKEDFSAFIEEWHRKIGEWATEKWDSVVETLETLKKGIKEKWENIKTDAKTFWDNFKTDLKGFAEKAGEGVVSGFEKLKSGLSEVWSNLKKDAMDAFDAVKKKAGEIWDNIKDKASNIGDKLGIGTSKTNTSSYTSSNSSIVSSTIGKVGNALSTAGSLLSQDYEKWKRQHGYATGGFPEDGLFFANHNELVGQFSNGRTAVANNAQITAGIEQATYNAMMRANSQSSNREEQLLEELISAVRQGSKISIDGREIVTAYDSRKARNGYSFA